MTTDYDRSDLISAMASTLFTLAYAAWVDEWDELDPADPENLDRPKDARTPRGGEDYADYATLALASVDSAECETFTQEASVLYGRIQQVLRVDPLVLCRANNLTASDAATWAHYLVMVAAGHGVAWEDSHEPLVYCSVQYATTDHKVYIAVPAWPGRYPQHKDQE